MIILNIHYLELVSGPQSQLTIDKILQQAQK